MTVGELVDYIRNSTNNEWSAFMPHAPTFRLGVPSDREAVCGLLEHAGLPASDLEASGVLLLLAEEGGALLGCVGIEARGQFALIRSLAVAQAARGNGLGRTMARRAEDFARAGGVATLYLLTTTAERFWSRLGYARVARAEVPAEVQASAEFAALCPQSAVCMRLDLGATKAEREQAADASKQPIDPAQVAQTAERHFASGLYCAESVALALAEALGDKADSLPRAATALCSGMARTRGTCGALTGAVLGVGLALGRKAAGQTVAPAYGATQAVIAAFEGRFGSQNCPALLDGCDLNTPEGQTLFKERGFTERCRAFTAFAAQAAAREIAAARSANPAAAGAPLAPAG